MAAASKTTGEKTSGLKAKLAQVRHGFPWVDRLVRMQEHYTRTRGNQMAGAVTYFAFLSFFPLLAVVFAVLGRVSAVYPQAQTTMVTYLKDNLPSLAEQIQLEQLAQSGATQAATGIIGGLSLLYSGLGCLDATREGLRQMWSLEPDRINVVKKKLSDVVVLVMLGSAMLVATAVSAVATSLSSHVVGWVGIDNSPPARFTIGLLGVVLAIAATTLIFVIIFARLPGHRLPWKNVLSGAAIAAVCVEVVKQLATSLLSGMFSADDGNRPALYGAFALAVGLLVYMNVLARITMYAAAWCVVGPVPTVEAQIAARGETLHHEEAVATSKARQRAESQDVARNIGRPHRTSAGTVAATTMGLLAPSSKGSSKDGSVHGSKDGLGTESKGSLVAVATLLALVGLRLRKRHEVAR